MTVQLGTSNRAELPVVSLQLVQIAALDRIAEEYRVPWRDQVRLVIAEDPVTLSERVEMFEAFQSLKTMIVTRQMEHVM